MFIYLSKKIAIPNNTKLRCIGWNKEHGYIACGGDDGLLKVLKLDSGKDGKVKGLAAPSNLSMNQTLEGHNGQIQVIGWNEVHQKLTTSDQYGLIIVWMQYKGSWYEEMINNRNKSVVKGMTWTPDGEKICIVYEDGAVIVGSVDGNRIWGKELKNTHLAGVCWSPDARLLLFSLATGEVHVYDAMGGFVSKLTLHLFSASLSKVICLSWYDGKFGHVKPDAPALAICFESGRIQLMRSETDENAVLIDSGMLIVSAQWSHDGSMFAVAGTITVTDGPDKDANVVQFYTPFGEHLRTLKVPGKQIAACAWEGGSLRIALAVDSFIYFANIRPDYKWAYFSNVIVYTFNKADRQDSTVVFWNCKTGDKHLKHVRGLISMAAYGEHCVLAAGHDEGDSYMLSLCNAIGTPIDTKQIDFEPLLVALTSGYVFAAHLHTFCVWHFRTAQSWTHIKADASSSQSAELKVVQVDDAFGSSPAAFKSPSDPICCLAASERILIVGRESGTLLRYALPNVTQTNEYHILSKPHKLALNSNSSCLAIIDTSGLLQLLDLDGGRSGDSKEGELIKFERKDVWDIKWAADNPDIFAMMEKTRMYIFRNMEPEEPILSAGYICCFQDLEIRAVLLDEILRDPESPDVDFVLNLEVKSLRDTRDLLEKVGIKDAMIFIEDNPHPRLWRLLAEAAVENMDLVTAEAAYVRCKNYPGIQFTKRLSRIQNETVRRAEVCGWFQRYDEAERLYLEVDRRDLAIGLRKRLGDWFKVQQLLKSGPVSGNDADLEEAWNHIGDYYAERHKWEDAVQYYEKASNIDQLVKCYYHLEDYRNLENMVDSLQPDDGLLLELGNMFASVGMGAQAVEAYLKCNRISQAIDTCVNLNQWHQAVELATKYKQPLHISSLLAKYAQHLLDENKRLQAIELYRKANHFLEAARLLMDLAKEETMKRSSPLRIKKLYVLAALMVEQHQTKLRKSSKDAAGGRSTALMGLLDEEGDDSPADIRIVESGWRGAEAFHLLMLCQRQLYDGVVDAAMKTALHLRHYEDILNIEDIYALLALTSCANRAFGTCSRAFIKLESLDQLSAAQRDEYQQLAMDIFVKHAPKDSRMAKILCPSCEERMPDWMSSCPSCERKFPICMVTGRPLVDGSSAWSCSRCHHSAYEQDMTLRHTCPLCHEPMHQ